MKRLLIGILLANIFCSCQSITGSGNIITEARNVNQFQGIKNSGSINVEIIQAETHTVKVEADDNIMEYVITKIEDGMLRISLKNNTSFRNINVTVYVTTQSIKKLSVSGSGTIISKNILKDDEQIEMKVTGSGEINVTVDAPSIVSDISGSGKITAQGRTKNFDCKISGSGDLTGRNLLSENTIINVSGSGNAHVFASVSLQAKVSGSGDIYYSGNPASPKIQTSGSGSIKAEK